MSGTRQTHAAKRQKGPAGPAPEAAEAAEGTGRWGSGEEAEG